VHDGNNMHRLAFDKLDNPIRKPVHQTETDIIVESIRRFWESQDEFNCLFDFFNEVVT